MASSKRFLRSRSEFSSDEDDISQSYKQNKAKKKSIMTTAASVPKQKMLDISKLTDDELRRKLLALDYDPGPVVESTRSVYEYKLMHLLTSESTGDKTSNGRENESEDYSDSEEEVVINNSRIQPSSSSARKRTFENVSSTGSQVIYSNAESKYNAPKYTDARKDIKYSSSDYERFNTSKSNYSSDGLKSNFYSRIPYEKSFERLEYSQLSRPSLHKEIPHINSKRNISKKSSRTKTCFALFIVICALIIFAYVVYQNMESGRFLEEFKK